jgi:MinD-like ATPase involved in chromosome partitioning or flagellar assembly
MIEMIKVVVACQSWAETQAIDAALRDHPEMQVVAGPTTASQAFKDATEMEADVVLLSPQIPGFSAGLIGDLLHYEERPIPSIGLIPPLESRADEMYAVGMKGHVSTPLDDVQIRRLLELIPEAVTKARAERQSADYTPLAAPTLQTVADSGWQRMTVAFWGTGGGVGKTSLAVNFAAAFGVIGMRKTLLMDLDMTRGAVAPRLKLRPEHNIFALFNTLVPEYNRAGRASCLPRHLTAQTQLWGRGRSSKLECLAGVPAMHVAGLPVFRDDPERTQALIRSVLETAHRQYDFVIVDLGPDINNDVHYTALDYADLVLTVVRPDVADVHSTAQTVPSLREVFGERVGKFELIVNQWTEEAGIRMKDLIDVIGMKKFGSVPYDPRYTYSGNMQTPFVLDQKPNPTSDAIVTMAARYFPPLAPIWVKRGGKVGGEAKAFQPQRRQEEGLGGKLKSLFVRGA